MLELYDINDLDVVKSMSYEIAKLFPNTKINTYKLTIQPIPSLL